jgi:hypothetical protein
MMNLFGAGEVCEFCRGFTSVLEHLKIAAYFCMLSLLYILKHVTWLKAFCITSANEIQFVGSLENGFSI